MTKLIRKIGKKLYIYENCYDKEKKKNKQKYIGKIENPSRSLKRIMFGEKWSNKVGRNSVSFDELPLYVIKKINAPENQGGGKVKDDEKIKPKTEQNKNKVEIKYDSGIPVSFVHMPSTKLLGFTLIELMGNLLPYNARKKLQERIDKNPKTYIVPLYKMFFNSENDSMIMQDNMYKSGLNQFLREHEITKK